MLIDSMYVKLFDAIRPARNAIKRSLIYHCLLLVFDRADLSSFAVEFCLKCCKVWWELKQLFILGGGATGEINDDTGEIGRKVDNIFTISKTRLWILIA